MVRVFAVLSAALLASALAPAAHARMQVFPSLFASEGQVLRPPGLFDPSVVVEAPPPSPKTAGTAFAFGAPGTWLSAGHVLEDCQQAAVIVGPGRGVVAKVSLDPETDVAVLTTEGGAAPLPSALTEPLRIGASGFHPGFPQGRPGEAVTRLVGRGKLVIRRPGHDARAERVLVWREVTRSEGLEGGLNGLSGAPVLDSEGRVVGLTLAEAPRRGRLYTVPPEGLVAALKRIGAPIASEAAATPITDDTASHVADTLRRDLRVAQVTCLKRGPQ
jgi:S1-C subfamily serine protease